MQMATADCFHVYYNRKPPRLESKGKLFQLEDEEEKEKNGKKK